jgi:predicted deacylase
MLAAAAAAASASTAATATQTRPDSRPAVVSSRIIGYSVNSHPMRAFELGNPKAEVTVVALAAIHGNETGGLVVLGDLRDGRPVKGVHLWVIPRDNPDGVLRHNRHNAHGVDLNRNFPTKWKPLSGYYYAGPSPSSEPETKALERFLNRVNPDYVVTFHSPLQGVDVYGAKDRPFARSLARHLSLPIKSYNCSGACHGTLTQWFNAHHQGACVTVEFSSSPSAGYLHVKAPRGLLHAIGGHF